MKNGMPKQEFDVVIECNSEGMFWGKVSRLGNCRSQGRTLNELMDSMREVILVTLDERMYENDDWDDEEVSFVGIQKVVVRDANGDRDFYVLVEWGEESLFIGTVPQLQGCLSCGDTLDELRANMEEVILLCLEDEEGTEYLEFVGIQKVTIYQNFE